MAGLYTIFVVALASITAMFQSGRPVKEKPQAVFEYVSDGVGVGVGVLEGGDVGWGVGEGVGVAATDGVGLGVLLAVGVGDTTRLSLGSANGVGDTVGTPIPTVTVGEGLGSFPRGKIEVIRVVVSL